MAGDKARFDVHSFLQTPINPKELFDFMGRFLERHSVRSDRGRRSSRVGPPVQTPTK
jgi:hypothetical protein